MNSKKIYSFYGLEADGGRRQIIENEIFLGNE